YLDQWNRNGFISGNYNNQYSDGFPDRHGDWGACIVNAGDPEWQRFIIEEAERLADYNIDGFFLDTPETADPWQGYGWTSEGFYSLIQLLDISFPNHLLLLNRGVFFFNPNHPHQYTWNPNRLIDIALFESYLFDNSYASDDSDYIFSPFFYHNKYYLSPKIQIALSEFDHNIPMIQVDYTRNPFTFPEKYAVLYSEYIKETVEVFGRIPYITDRYLNEISTVFFDNQPVEDNSPPIWQDSTRGHNNLFEEYMYFSSITDITLPEEEFRKNPYIPRVGIQKMIPSNGSLRILWDVATDQSRPVSYNIYYTDRMPFDFSTANKIRNVPYIISTDYTIRGQVNADNACPYEYTLTGLENGKTYFAAVRAEDSSYISKGGTLGLSDGKNHGYEEQNMEILAAIPVDDDLMHRPTINIDGNPLDWKKIPSISFNETLPANNSTFKELAVHDDFDYIYIAVEKNGSPDFNQTKLLINSDLLSFTGDSDFRGADYLFQNGIMYRYEESWIPMNNTQNIRYASNGSFFEIAIPKTILKNLFMDHIILNLYDETEDIFFPKSGSSGIYFILAASNIDKDPPVFTSEKYTIDTQSISETVILSWAEAEDESEKVSYTVLNSDTGIVHVNNNGKPLTRLDTASAVITGLPQGKNTNLLIVAEDQYGNKTQLPELAVKPNILFAEPEWVPWRSPPEIHTVEQIPVLYFSAALENRSPANYNLKIEEINTDMKDIVLESIQNKLSDKKDFDYSYAIPQLEPFTDYIIKLEAVGTHGLPSKDVFVIPYSKPGFHTVSLESIDGFFEDWENDSQAQKLVHSRYKIFKDKSKVPEIIALYYVFRDSHLFFHIITEKQKNLSNNLLILLDIDNNKSTGFSSLIGADFALSGSGQLYKLASGDAWDPLFMGNIPYKQGVNESSHIEMALSEKLVGSFSDQLAVVFNSFLDSEKSENNNTYGPLELYKSNTPPTPDRISIIVIIAIIMLFLLLILFTIPDLIEKKKIS
ncbi:MAG: hypothetical protein K9N07_11105, partial [Candidatus Cloacimonetes bacterium]|nr:hypothetical protein [Candidatus Cloacimonadota bacterium]